jgi:hypothetical protein
MTRRAFTDAVSAPGDHNRAIPIVHVSRRRYGGPAGRRVRLAEGGDLAAAAMLEQRRRAMVRNRIFFGAAVMGLAVSLAGCQPVGYGGVGYVAPVYVAPVYAGGYYGGGYYGGGYGYRHGYYGGAYRGGVYNRGYRGYGHGVYRGGYRGGYHGGAWRR